MIKENKRIEEVRAKLKKADELQKEALDISRFLSQDKMALSEIEEVKIELQARCTTKTIVFKRGDLFNAVIYPMLDTMEAYLAKKEKEWRSFEI